MKEILNLFQFIKKVNYLIQQEDSEAEAELTNLYEAIAEITIQTRLWSRRVSYTYHASLVELKYLRPELLDLEAERVVDRWFSDLDDLVERELDATKGDCNSKGNQMRIEDERATGGDND
jgi:hypothetical protein